MKTIKLKNGVELNLTKEQEQELLAQLEKKKGRWKPEEGESYYYIDGDCEVCETEQYDSDYYKFRYSIGNVYRTEKEAQEALDTGWVARLQSEQRIKDYILEKGYDAGNSDEHNYSIYYSSFWGDSGIDFRFDSSARYTNLRFKYKHEAEETMNACKEDYKLLLGVE